MAAIPQILPFPLCKWLTMLLSFFLSQWSPQLLDELYTFLQKLYRLKVNQADLSVSLVLPLYLLWQFFTPGSKGSSLGWAGVGRLNLYTHRLTYTRAPHPVTSRKRFLCLLSWLISYCSLRLARSRALKLQSSLVFMIHVAMWRMERIQSKCHDQGGLPFNWEPVCVCVCVCV